jgi:hyaluronoglucosaminidase
MPGKNNPECRLGLYRSLHLHSCRLRRSTRVDTSPTVRDCLREVHPAKTVLEWAKIAATNRSYERPVQVCLMQTEAKFNLGVIEGFFGKPWDWAARLNSADFLSDWGYLFYIYAPKSEPFLRRRWREPMPLETMQRLSELSSRFQHRGVSFGVGLTPFEIYLDYDSRAKAALRSKVLQLNEVRGEMLCILFDDMRGDVADLPDIQANVVSDVCGWSNAKRFIVCPTYYSYDSRLTREFGPPPKTYLREFGRLIDPRVDIFWTGEKVISDGYTLQHLEEVATAIQRKPFIWDNHISNDSRIRTQQLFLDPSSGGWSLPTDLVAGLAINPMNQPYLSRIALCGYQHLLAQPSPPQFFPDLCRQLAGSPCAEWLLADFDLFQNAALNELDSDARHRLLNRYESEHTNPYAQEIAAWLRDEYAFDPQCLTT